MEPGHGPTSIEDHAIDNSRRLGLVSRASRVHFFVHLKSHLLAMSFLPLFVVSCLASQGVSFQLFLVVLK